MLTLLRLENVGPAAELELEPAPRINLITGDNGLGKSFLLDVAWWSLTKQWPAEINPRGASGLMARPTRSGVAAIEFRLQGTTRQAQTYRSEFDRRAEAWKGKPTRPISAGLVLYAQVDGGFAVWDPARNYTKKQVGGVERQPAYVFSSREVWDGLRVGEAQPCNGLLADWALWQKEGKEAFAQLVDALAALSPSNAEPLKPGQLTKLSVDDARWIPTLRMPYGVDVPVLHASAAIKRVVALAYLLVWSWQEHRRTAALLDEPPAGQITFLIDELDCHLHPRWQRTIVKSLLAVMRDLARSAKVQLVAATHSPLLMASVEPLFDPKQDAWFDLDLDSGTKTPCVRLARRDFLRRGDASSWLTSEAFDLGSARSLEAEQVLEKASVALSEASFGQADADDLHLKLRDVLGEDDPFWLRWRFVGEKRGWLPPAGSRVRVAAGRPRPKASRRA